MPEPKTPTCETSLPIEQKIELARNATLHDVIDRTYQPYSGSSALTEAGDPAQQYQVQHNYTLLVGLEAAAVVSTEIDPHAGILAETAEIATAVTQILVTEAAVRRCAYTQALLGKNDLTAPASTMLGKLHQSHLSRIFGSLEQEERRVHALAMSNLCTSYLGHGNFDQAVIDTAKASVPRQLRDEEEAFGACLRSQHSARQHRVRSFGQALLRAHPHRRRFSLTPVS